MRISKLSFLFGIFLLPAAQLAVAIVCTPPTMTRCPPIVDGGGTPNGRPPDIAIFFSSWKGENDRLARISTTFAGELSAGVRLTSGQRRVALHLDIPAVFTGSADVKAADVAATRSYRALIFAPGLRLRIAATDSVYPWLSVGAGLAHFSPSSVNQAGGISTARSTNTGAFQAGAGVDFRIAGSPVIFRAQVRDYYTGGPELGSAQIKPRNNVMAGGGVVFRF
jgi:hypothetical protein